MRVIATHEPPTVATMESAMDVIGFAVHGTGPMKNCTAAIKKLLSDFR